MLVYNYLIYALIGVVVGILLKFILQNRVRNKWIFPGLFVLITTILIFVARTTFIPAFEFRQILSSLEDSSQTKEFVQTVQEYEPDIYDQMIDEFKESYYAGNFTLGKFTSISSNYSSFLVNRNALKASDTSIILFMTNSVYTMKQLLEQNDTACYYYLFPPNDNSLNISALYDDTTKTKSMQTVINVIVTAHTAPQEYSQVQNLDSAWVQIGEKLIGKYGDDFNILTNPVQLGVDKKLTCEIIIDLYETILAYDTPTAGAILKRMISLYK